MSNANQPSDAELADRLAALDATPGPWTVVRYGDGNSLVIHDARGDWRVCFMATPSDCDTMEDIEANAELICLLRNYLPQIIAALSRPTASQDDDERVGLAVWCVSIADHHADVLSPRQIEKLYAASDALRAHPTASQPALVDALRPFAEAGAELAASSPSDMAVVFSANGKHVCVADLRHAYAALSARPTASQPADERAKVVAYLRAKAASLELTITEVFSRQSGATPTDRKEFADKADAYRLLADEIENEMHHGD